MSTPGSMNRSALEGCRGAVAAGALLVAILVAPTAEAKDRCPWFTRGACDLESARTTRGCSAPDAYWTTLVISDSGLSDEVAGSAEASRRNAERSCEMNRWLGRECSLGDTTCCECGDVSDSAALVNGWVAERVLGGASRKVGSKLLGLVKEFSMRTFGKWPTKVAETGLALRELHRKLSALDGELPARLAAVLEDGARKKSGVESPFADEGKRKLEEALAAHDDQVAAEVGLADARLMAGATDPALRSAAPWLFASPDVGPVAETRLHRPLVTGSHPNPPAVRYAARARAGGWSFLWVNPGDQAVTLRFQADGVAPTTARVEPHDAVAIDAPHDGSPVLPACASPTWGSACNVRVEVAIEPSGLTAYREVRGWPDWLCADFTDARNESMWRQVGVTYTVGGGVKWHGNCDSWAR